MEDEDIKYIVGIDFGHGETTANYVEIFDRNTNQYSESKQLLIKAKSKIRSFFCRYRSFETERFYQKGVDNFNQNRYREACANFRHAVDAFLEFKNLPNVSGSINFFDDACALNSTNNDNYEESARYYKQLIENAWIYDLDPRDNNISNYIKKRTSEQWTVEFHHSFKKPIDNSDSYLEQIFGKFVKCVYKKIIADNGSVGLSVNDDMSPQNFLLYAACPSGWSDDQRERFRMFLGDNGVPCKKVFKESDAAWISFIPPRIGDLGNPKMLVIDYGSSTIDLTWSEDNRQDICNENEFGASKVESLVFDYLVGEGEFNGKYNGDEIAKEEYNKVKSYLQDDIMAEEIIKLGIREEKEEFYSGILENPNSNEIVFQPYILSKALPRNIGLGYFGNALPANDVHTIILESYKDKVKRYFEEFRRDHMEESGSYIVPEKIILTGGASRMKFVQELVYNVFGVRPTFDEAIASSTISSGIAIAGTRDFLSGDHIITDPGRFNEEEIRSTIQNIVNEKIQAHVLSLLNSIFDSWQEGNIVMDTEHNLHEDLIEISENMKSQGDVGKNNFTALWFWVKENATSGREFSNGNKSIHALFYAIMDSIKGVNINEDYVLLDNITQSIADNYNNEIESDIVPRLLNYVKIYAPLTTEADLKKLITIKLERIDAIVEISNEALTQFLTILVKTAYQTIQDKDLSGVYERTLNKDRGDSYRNGYFGDLRNDFETFSKIIEASIRNLNQVANSISNSIVEKMNEIQKYCTSIRI